VQSEFKSVRTFTKVSLLISVTTQQCLDGLADGDLGDGVLWSLIFHLASRRATDGALE